MALLMALISGADLSRWMAGLMEGGQAGPVSASVGTSQAIRLCAVDESSAALLRCCAAALGLEVGAVGGASQAQHHRVGLERDQHRGAGRLAEHHQRQQLDQRGAGQRRSRPDRPGAGPYRCPQPRPRRGLQPGDEPPRRGEPLPEGGAGLGEHLRPLARRHGPAGHLPRCLHRHRPAHRRSGDRPAPGGAGRGRNLGGHRDGQGRGRGGRPLQPVGGFSGEAAPRSRRSRHWGWRLPAAAAARSDGNTAAAASGAPLESPVARAGRERY
jgi:hypothetical protein